MNSRLRQGDVVTIYEDPFQRTKIEGKARLLTHLAVRTHKYNGELVRKERWEVQFVDDTETVRDRVCRTIVMGEGA